MLLKIASRPSTFGLLRPSELDVAMNDRAMSAHAGVGQ